jgi:hypothetical protein
LQTSPVSQTRPGQQPCPGAPHAWQIPATHAPLEQVLLLQHADPSPQAELLLLQPPTMKNKDKDSARKAKLSFLMARR